MADWTRDDIARLLSLLERLAAALEGRSGAPPLGGSTASPGRTPEAARRDRGRQAAKRTARMQRELGS